MTHGYEKQVWLTLIHVMIMSEVMKVRKQLHDTKYPVGVVFTFCIFDQDVTNFISWA